MKTRIRLFGLYVANGCARKEREVAGALGTPSLEGYTHLLCWVPALSVCASGFHSRLWARCAVCRPDRAVRSMYCFLYWSLSDPSLICCTGLREDYYNRFKVPAMRLCATSFSYILTSSGVVSEGKTVTRRA